MISKERAKERISWIDTAKGFLMLCVIAGHTLRLGSIPQRMIYSFHIPLFVILSGFTMGDVDCWKTYWLKLKKSFLSLYVPMLIIYFLEVFGYTIRDKLSPSEVIEKLYATCVYAIHVPWFLCVLFWARLFYNLILVKKFENPILFILVFLSGFFICKIPGFHGFYQQFEKVPFFMFFLFCGRYARKYNIIEVLEKHAVLILFFALIIWQIFLPHSYFDLGLFYLGDPRFAIPCSFVACIAVIILCRTVDSYLANGGKLLRLPSFIGLHSILLLAIHDLEFMFFPWHTNFTTRFDEYGTLLLRIAFDLAVWGYCLFVINLYKEYKRTKND